MVAKGEVWLDCEIAKLVLPSIPKPNSNDLDNLYCNKEIKNNLTSRELEVLRLLIEGKTNSQIDTRRSQTHENHVPSFVHGSFGHARRSDPRGTRNSQSVPAGQQQDC